MKKLLIFALAAICLASCTKKQEVVLNHTNWAYGTTVYELNMLQFTEQGTFVAAEHELMALKVLGVDIIKVMPVQPFEEACTKCSECCHRLQNYRKFNSEMGTRDEFVSFVNKAHEMDMYVMLEWVANHALESEAMQNQMVQDLRWWIDSIGVDGFCCNTPAEISVDFWNEAMNSLRVDFPGLLTIAQNEDMVNELTTSAFDVYYGQQLYEIMNAVAQDSASVEDLWNYFDACDSLVNPMAIRLNYTSNTFANAFDGTEFARMNNMAGTMAAFTYFVPGMPMIYNGQEFASKRSIGCFEKAAVEHNHADEFAMYQDLNNMRKNNPALWAPELGAPMVRIACDNNKIFAGAREIIFDNGNINTVLGIFNMSGEEQTFVLQTAEFAGNYTCICGMPVVLGEEDKITLKPYEWLIYAK